VPVPDAGAVGMSGNTSEDVRDLLEGVRGGDEHARRELLDRVHHRLRRIAAAMFHRDFPRLRDRHDLESVVDEAWLRLAKALEGHAPESPDQFFGLLFRKVRQVLIDMAQAQDRRDARLAQGAPDGEDSRVAPDPTDETHEPSRLAMLTEIHRRIGELPDEQRLVFELHYFGDLDQAQIARTLNYHPKRVSRLWLAATGHLAECLDGIQGLL
jgi:RNA polymerase sigma factor (sigma-70 family)